MNLERRAVPAPAHAPAPAAPRAAPLTSFDAAEDVPAGGSQPDPPNGDVTGGLRAGRRLRGAPAPPAPAFVGPVPGQGLSHSPFSQAQGTPLPGVHCFLWHYLALGLCNMLALGLCLGRHFAQTQALHCIALQSIACSLSGNFMMAEWFRRQCILMVPFVVIKCLLFCCYRAGALLLSEVQWHACSCGQCKHERPLWVIERVSPHAGAQRLP